MVQTPGSVKYSSLAADEFKRVGESNRYKCSHQPLPAKSKVRISSSSSTASVLIIIQMRC